jgi:CheY-like chemotaxis protein
MGTSKKHILVVDDEELMRALLIAALDAEGYDVVAVDDRQALHAVYADPPMMIFVDLMRPTLTGEEICRQVRAQPDIAAIPIIAMSAGRALGAVMDLGIFNDYLPKPFSLCVLAQVVDRWIPGQRDKLTTLDLPCCHEAPALQHRA